MSEHVRTLCFAYVHNDPVNATDPTGMQECNEACLNTFAFGGLDGDYNAAQRMRDADAESAKALANGVVNNLNCLIEFAASVTSGNWEEGVPDIPEPFTISDPDSQWIADTMVAVGVTAITLRPSNPSAPMSVADEAAAISQQIGRNSVQVPTRSGAVRFDLVGAAHKGVPTPHVQLLRFNTNSVTGNTYLNKVPGVRPMNVHDLRVVRSHLEEH